MAISVKKTIFCANCQAQTEHDCSPDKNGEVVFACSCGRFLKAPLFARPEELDAYLATHHQANVGQVQTDTSAEEQARFDERFKRMMGVG